MAKTTNPAAEQTTVTVTGVSGTGSPSEWDRFKDVVQQVVSVPKEAVKRGKDD